MIKEFNYMDTMKEIKILYRYYCQISKDDSIKWNQLLLSNVCYPEHQEEAVMLISNGLGYTPQAQVYSDEIPFIRTAIHQRKIGQLSAAEFVMDITTTVMQIRNKQMKNEERTRDFVNRDFEVYYRICTQYKHKARKLLQDILGFETKVAHSLEAELILRLSYLANSDIEFKDFDSMTYYAATIALYRYNYIEHGEAVANDTPLLGLEIPSKRILPKA